MSDLMQKARHAATWRALRAMRWLWPSDGAAHGVPLVELRPEAAAVPLNVLLRAAADALHLARDVDDDLEGVGDAVDRRGQVVQVDPRCGRDDVAEVLREVAEHPCAEALGLSWGLSPILSGNGNRGTGNGDAGWKKFRPRLSCTAPRPSAPLPTPPRGPQDATSAVIRRKPSEIKLNAKLGWRNDEIRLGVVFEVAGHKTRIEYVLSCERDLKEDSIILIGH